MILNFRVFSSQYVNQNNKKCDQNLVLVHNKQGNKACHKCNLNIPRRCCWLYICPHLEWFVPLPG